MVLLKFPLVTWPKKPAGAARSSRGGGGGRERVLAWPCAWLPLSHSTSSSSSKEKAGGAQPRAGGERPFGCLAPPGVAEVAGEGKGPCALSFQSARQPAGGKCQLIGGSKMAIRCFLDGFLAYRGGVYGGSSLNGEFLLHRNALNRV